MSYFPLVSIVVLTYNGEKFLKDQLNSIYAQTYKNIEVIAFDDASTDQTVTILEQYKKSDNLTYYVNKTNVGINKNFMQALKKCKGEFICPSDQDDIWMKNKTQLFVKHIQENIMIYSKSIMINEKGFIQNKDSLDLNYSSVFNAKSLFLFNLVSAHNMMFKKELIPFIEDVPDIGIYYDWWISFIASNYGAILYFPESLVQHRLHNTQLTSSKRKEKNFNVFTNFIKKDKQKISKMKNQITILKSFSELKIIDIETKQNLNILISSLKSLLNSYFNKKLYSIILAEKDVYFLAKEHLKRKKTAKNAAKGIWYYRLRLYL